MPIYPKLFPQDFDTAEPETMTTAAPKKAATDQGLSEPYTILRKLPGYKIGHKLRHKDEILCYSKEATAWAMNRLQADDCVFVLRSDGSYTYSVFKGHSKEKGTFSFLVDYYGRFKELPAKQFCNRIKVPVRSPWLSSQQQARAAGGADLDKPIRPVRQARRRATISCGQAPQRSQHIQLNLKWQKTLESLSPKSTMLLPSTPSDRALVVERDDEHQQLDEQDLISRLKATNERVQSTLDGIISHDNLPDLTESQLDNFLGIQDSFVRNQEKIQLDDFFDIQDSIVKNQERSPRLSSRALESLPFTGSRVGTSAGAKSC